ncbi:MAG: 50S ribosomal protein L6 [Burkholderiales bacterium]|nr:50S ribosomal protein L6 [Burkholderiales bacterium]
MSRVARIPVEIAKGNEAKIEGDIITIKGPKGTLTQKLSPRVEVKLDNGKVTFKALDSSKESNAMSGTLRALVNSMNKGVSEGFAKKLTLIGVGYRAQAQGNKLTLNLGYSHPIVYELPQGITAQTPTPTEINISGADKQKVGQVAAEVRAFRPPEPYKGKGVRYADETVVIKETKKK